MLVVQCFSMALKKVDCYSYSKHGLLVPYKPNPHFVNLQVHFNVFGQTDAQSTNINFTLFEMTVNTLNRRHCC